MPSDDPDRPKGPGGLGLRQAHEPAKSGVARDRAAQKTRNPLAERQARWQRLVRYVWGRSGRR